MLLLAVVTVAILQVVLGYHGEGRLSRLSMKAGGEPVLNKYSRIITEPPSQGASQAMLYATGLTPKSINNPQVRGIT